jgi:hypothetical protein
MAGHFHISGKAKIATHFSSLERKEPMPEAIEASGMGSHHALSITAAPTSARECARSGAHHGCG